MGKEAVETHRRTLAKALTWRLIAVVTTASIAWAVTGSPRLAASIGLLDCAFKLALYYAHERLWNRVKFGRADPPEYQI